MDIGIEFVYILNSFPIETHLIVHKSQLRNVILSVSLLDATPTQIPITSDIVKRKNLSHYGDNIVARLVN